MSVSVTYSPEACPGNAPGTCERTAVDPLTLGCLPRKVVRTPSGVCYAPASVVKQLKLTGEELPASDADTVKSAASMQKWFDDDLLNGVYEQNEQKVLTAIEGGAHVEGQAGHDALLYTIACATGAVGIVEALVGHGATVSAFVVGLAMRNARNKPWSKKHKDIEKIILDAANK